MFTIEDRGQLGCASSPCQEGGTCEDHDGTFTCFCTENRWPRCWSVSLGLLSFRFKQFPATVPHSTQYPACKLGQIYLAVYTTPGTAKVHPSHSEWYWEGCSAAVLQYPHLAAQIETPANGFWFQSVCGARGCSHSKLIKHSSHFNVLSPRKSLQIY